jgi:ABC-type oligopeptide transport system substrate-binding subunit/class 3 adenylate cyclase
MSKLLTAMAPYVPPTLIDAILGDPNVPTDSVVERFRAAVLFADVSGFTPLTEALAQSGSEGPEELTRVLNQYFSRMIALIEAEGGTVVKFSGDAVTVLFPATAEPLGHAVRRAKQTADAMQAAMVEFATMKTSVGPIALGMKIGIGAGEVLTMQIGGVSERWEYVIAGDPLRQVAEAEKQAERGEITLSPEATAILHPAALPPRALVRPDWSTVTDPETVSVNFRRFVPSAVRVWLDKALPEWVAVLRPMTVLFVGVSGLDYARPEAVGQLHIFLKAVQEITYRYEGSINKLTIDDKGTVLLVLFGAPPRSHEDDPVRAVHCALDMQKIAEQQGLHLAVGVTTGHVFAGPVGSETRREYTVMGDTVNLAARLMGKAGAWGILCDFDTYRQASDKLAFERLAPIRVKGKAELIRIYCPTGETVGEPSAVLSEKGALIGREAEVTRLMAALDTVDAGESRVLIIEGPAGIGKSRLAAKLSQTVRERGLTDLVGAGQSIEHHTPYRAWRDIFLTYFDLKALTDPAMRQSRVRSTVKALTPEQILHLPLLNDVLNLRIPETDLTAALDPAQRRQTLVEFLLALLRAWVREHPLILVLENAQWLDSLSWQLVVHVVEAMIAAEEPMLLVLVTRPIEEDSFEGQQVINLRTLAETETLSLPPLSPEETVVIATACLGLPSGGLPAPIADLVLQRAGGNPFFAEQLVLTLQDQGLIEISKPTNQLPQCTIVGDLSEASQTLPSTIQGLILARIDRLLPPERQLTLKVGSVIGYIFPYLPLSDTIKQHAPITDVDLQSHLEALDASELTSRYAAQPELAYTFKQSIMQDVTYQSLPFAQRRRLHREVAQWYETTYATDLSLYYGLLAYHWSNTRDAEKAIHYLLLAGDEARGLYALQEAIDYYRQALEFLREQEDDEQTARTLMKLGLTYHLAFDFRGARQAYEEGFALWQKAGEIQEEEALPLAPHPLRVDWPYMPLTLDPSLAEEKFTIGVVDQLFSGLVDLGPEMNVLPNLARSWEILEEGRKYVFHLRDDVHWSDGSLVTAADFEYAWKRLLSPTTGSLIAGLLYDVKGARSFHQGKTSNPDDIGIHTLDDFTLVVELEQPTGYFLYLMANSASYPVPRHVVETHGRAWTETQNLVTNGPFALESWTQESDQDGELVLSRNPKYHGRFTGNVQRVELRARPDVSARLNAYDAGELDTLSFHDFSQKGDRVRQRHAGEYLSVPFLAITYVGFDVNRTPFDDPQVRQAFVMGVDRERYSDVNLKGFAFPATAGFIPPGMPAHSAGIGLPYDPDQARHLLVQAGYPGGEGFPAVEFLSGPDPGHQGDYLVTQWEANLGVTVAWKVMDWNVFIDRLETTLPHIFLNLWVADYPDPDNFLRASQPIRWTGWRDETYRQLVETARQVIDQQARIEIYRQADRMLVEAAVLMPFKYLRSHLLVRPGVRKFPTSAAWCWYWKDVIIEPRE